MNIGLFDNLAGEIGGFAKGLLGQVDSARSENADCKKPEKIHREFCGVLTRSTRQNGLENRWWARPGEAEEQSLDSACRIWTYLLVIQKNPKAVKKALAA
jgi:hypothetical protein